MSLRKTAALLAVAGLVIGLLGSGVGASFIDQVTGTENISVGSFACLIVEPSDGTIAADQKSVTYTAPTIDNSAPGSAPFSFTVENTGSTSQTLTVAMTGQSGNLGGKFSAIPATPASATVAPGATQLVSTGIQWTELDNDDLGRSGSMTWTVSCAEGSASAPVIFDNTAASLPSNLPSYGPEAYSYNEWGAQVAFAGTARKLSTATVTMSSWTCQTGTWNGGDCATTPGATFNVPITFNVYNVGSSNSVGSLITTKTQTFAIPYRPSADNVNCTGGNAGKWFDGTSCFSGKAVNITFAFAGETVPDNAIFGITFDTDHYGYSPINGSNNPTDSLNIATYPGNGVSTPASVGSWAPDDSSAYLSAGNPAGAFSGPVSNMPTGPSDNFVGYMPAVQITANN
ncbi:MAG TPA: hypothetical protein VH371_00620 [Candidatus Limnocylindrales bacterium]